MKVYQAAVSKQGASALLALATLSDAAEAQCRAGHEEAGLDDALRAYDGALRSFGEKNGYTQSISTTVAFCQILSRQYGLAGLRLDAIDRREVAHFSADDSYAARVDLMRAEIAHADGEPTQAQALLRAARQAFERPDADPYYRRWTLRLAASISPAVIATTGSIQR